PHRIFRRAGRANFVLAEADPSGYKNPTRTGRGRPRRHDRGSSAPMAKKTATSDPPTKTKKSAATHKASAASVREAIEAGEGILRLAPTWVPRSFLMPGRRLKLHPDDLYAYGAKRGGIDERWFAPTTPAAHEGRVPDEGLSYSVLGGKKSSTLADAVAAEGAALIGKPLWDTYKRWPVYSKFFDNMGPIPHHMHQSREQAKLVGQEGKPESYYFPPQMNSI